MMTWLMIAAANILVGAMVGLCGVAGFLLPMFYTSVLRMNVSEGLALSFAAFIVSGILGSVNYNKDGNLDIKFGLKLSLGSIIGAVIGVKLNMIIPEEQAKLLLYMVVLLSGISILVRKDKANNEGTRRRSFKISEHFLLTVIIGITTGAVCSMSGAGGPVLVMPLLVVMGIEVRTAVGVALLNSVFIGIPAAAGYLGQTDIALIIPILILALVTHGIGVYFGSKNASKINQKLLKQGIAVFSIAIASCKLLGIF